MIWIKSGRVCLGGLAASLAMAGAAPLDGTWGGEHLRIVADARGASVEGDCADGHIPGPITLTTDGGFVAEGSFRQHIGGPQPADPGAGQARAKYMGEIKGDVMTLTIAPMGAAAQWFTLRRGAVVKLHRCQ